MRRSRSVGRSTLRIRACILTRLLTTLLATTAKWLPWLEQRGRWASPFRVAVSEVQLFAGTDEPGSWHHRLTFPLQT